MIIKSVGENIGILSYRKEVLKLSVERICGYCKSKEPSDKYTDKSKEKEKMEISLENIDNFVYYKKTTYHKKCFGELKLNYKWKLSSEDIEKIFEDSKIHLKEALFSDQIYRFMLDNYDLTVIDNRVFQKLQSIYSGTFGGMSIGIPIADLLDMWQRKIKYLNKVHNQNITKGKSIEGNNRILYDLSVLVNKYDSYLQWKREQQILQANMKSDQQQNDKQKINFGLIERQIKNQENNSSSEDINSLLDEIF